MSFGSSFWNIRYNIFCVWFRFDYSLWSIAELLPCTRFTPDVNTIMIKIMWLYCQSPRVRLLRTLFTPPPLFIPPLNHLTPLFTPPFSDRMPSRFADNNHLLCHPWGERVYFWQQVDNPLMLHDPPMMKFPAKYIVIHEISNCASIILLSVSMHGWPMSIQDRNMLYVSMRVFFKFE